MAVNRKALYLVNDLTGLLLYAGHVEFVRQLLAFLFFFLFAANDLDSFRMFFLVQFRSDAATG